MMLERGIPPAHVQATCYDNALACYGQSGQFNESDWLAPKPIDQRVHFSGSTVLRGQEPVVPAKDQLRALAPEPVCK
jgi:hypothetical protein